MTMRQMETLVGRMSFDECRIYLENDSACGMDQLMLDRMEELDKGRFIKFMATFA